MTTQCRSNVCGEPGTDPKEIRPVGRVGRIEELPLQGRQGLGLVTDQHAVNELEKMVALRLGQAEAQGTEKAFQGR
jgi:hypothetical protein